MVLGTAFTLFFVPAIYVLLARDHRSANKEKADSRDTEEPQLSLEVAS
jgi:hypothetical protein